MQFLGFYWKLILPYKGYYHYEFQIGPLVMWYSLSKCRECCKLPAPTLWLDRI